MEGTGCEVNCGAPTTFAVQGKMMGEDNPHHGAPAKTGPSLLGIVFCTFALKSRLIKKGKSKINVV